MWLDAIVLMVLGDDRLLVWIRALVVASRGQTAGEEIVFVKGGRFGGRPVLVTCAILRKQDRQFRWTWLGVRTLCVSADTIGETSSSGNG